MTQTLGPVSTTTRLLAGLPFTNLEFAAAVAAVIGASHSNRWHYLVTPNAFLLDQCRLDSDLRQIYRNAAFCFLDSRVVFRAAKLVGLCPPPVVTGADLVEHLFRHIFTASTSVCIVGGRPSSIEKLQRDFALSRLKHLNPTFGFWRDEEESARIVEFIVASRADYTFLVLGSPQQEKLAARVAVNGGARGIGICAGASIDFLTGVQSRAPRLVRSLALEWAYRLCREPRRLTRRYVIESPRGVLFALSQGSRSSISQADDSRT